MLALPQTSGGPTLITFRQAAYQLSESQRASRAKARKHVRYPANTTKDNLVYSKLYHHAFKEAQSELQRLGAGCVGIFTKSRRGLPSSLAT